MVEGLSAMEGRQPRPRNPKKCRGEGRTQQQFKDECDINRIMAKYRKTGELEHLAKHEPEYGNFSTGLDYAEASNRVLAAESDFMALSGEIRQRMDNDPGKLLAFMADPENIEEARELGLIAPAPRSEPEPGPQGAAASPAPGATSPEPQEPAPATPVAGGE